jgi:putative intracellular protease/amidase
MEVAILLFDRLTTLDAIGPYEVLSRLPGATVRMVAKQVGSVRNDTGSLALVADYALDQTVSPDIVVVPGAGPRRFARARSCSARPAC